eukprot:scaffold28190_cov70-Cyclotella_meneghiniana.AAC.3
MARKSKTTDNTANDEQIARNLQNQFHQEMDQHASSSTWSNIHSILTPEDNTTRTSIYHDAQEDIECIIPVVNAIPDNDVDTTAATPPTKKKVSLRDISFSTTSTSPSTSMDESPLNNGPISIDEFIEEDAELARRLELEMRDERLARELRVSQEFNVDIIPTNESDAELAMRLQREQELEQRRGLLRLRRLPENIWGQHMSPGLDPASWLPGWPEGDPNLGSVGEVNFWDMDGNYHGLTLQVLNNLEEGSDWHQYFDTSVIDWNDGTPDAVNLYLRYSAYDADCRAVRKAMKVCNGNYGPTDWRGVNQILLQDEYIITSLAKMNDYYLEGTNMAQKQYTMCHELGHGLGLGHTDENFYNKDLGNCMDYTEKPQNNMHPDESNFRKLEEMYGNIDGTSVRPADTKVRTRRVKVSPKDEQTRKDEFEMYSKYLSDPIQVSTMDEQQQIGDGWRLLRKTDTVEHHERDLGNGYKIRTSILLAI